MVCEICNASMLLTNLKRHKNGNQCKTFECSICKDIVPFMHRKRHKTLHSHNPIRGDTNKEIELPLFEIDEDFIDIYSKFAKYIKPYIKRGPLMTTYNFQMKDFTTSAVNMILDKIFECQINTFKISISFSYILKNCETGEFAFYCSSQNNQCLLDKPSVIRNKLDIINIKQKIQNINLEDHVSYPTTKYIFIKCTNVTFFVVRFPGIAIGSPIKLPGYILYNKGLYSLTVSSNSGKPYADKYCFFRAVALHEGAKLTALEKHTKRLLKHFCDTVSIGLSDFDGVALDQLEDASKIFNIGINVYTQYKDRRTELIYRTVKQENILYLNLYGEHFSYIKDLNMYSSSYCCNKCQKIWKNHWDFKRHMKSCDTSTRKIYSYGAYNPKQTIFEQLAENDINIPECHRFFEYYICFDIECMMNADFQHNNTTETSYLYEHALASISVCSNVPGFLEPNCFVSDGNPKKLVKKALDYMNKISAESRILLEDKYSDYIPQIDKLDNVKLQEKFVCYLSQIPTISFNGAKYDLRVLREHLIPVLVEMKDIDYVIKKGSSYACIATSNLKFLDIINYLSPGYNYDSFIKAYGTSVSKSYWCYEWFTDLDKLNETHFPEYNDFYSSLKSRNTFEPQKTDGISEDEIELIGRNPTKIIPLTPLEISQIGQYRYHNLRQMYHENNWSMRDFLIYYNNLDVKPFIEAIKNMTSYYTQRSVDIFKDAISVPGVAQRLAFKSLKFEDTFFLFNKRHKDLVDLFLMNNTGGPALIFDRYQEKDETTIRHKPGGKLCKKILGLDANALYLDCLAQNMPTGIYIRRRDEESFKKEYPLPLSAVSTEWLAYIEQEDNINIQHARNGGEHKIGPKRVPVDGYCKETKIVYNFHGCWFHGCLVCYPKNRNINSKSSNNRYSKTLSDKWKHTQQIAQYIRECGFNLIEMWECKWKEFKKTHQIANPYALPTEHFYRMSQQQLLDHIRRGEIFGAAEIDIKVPDYLKSFFADFPPIFKNTIVTEADIGKHMTAFLQQTNTSYKPRRYLIGSMFAEKQLFITPLIQWYLKMGLEVTKIYQVIEFTPRKCFQNFANKVSDDRRAGDCNPNMRVIADTSKLIGNSVYGYSIMNKDKHLSIEFCDEDRACQLVNDPRFMSLEEFEDETYEVQSKKKTIKYDLPVQIGFFVYSYAKLKMLSFYYEVLDRFFEHDDFCVIEMDTDSFYLALSANTLDELVKPHLRKEWKLVKEKWFPRNDTPENVAYDRRTPGLFKIEWSGDGFIGLLAKTYFCYNKLDTNNDKYSAKGINRTLNLTRELFRAVLDTKESSSQTNKGFILKDKHMYTYNMKKVGLSYFYCKRKVLDNGISTTFLDI